MDWREFFAALKDADENAHYALWGYDGMGGIGPKEEYRQHLARQQHELWANLPTPKPDDRRHRQGWAQVGTKRSHRRGHGWKASHTDNQ